MSETATARPAEGDLAPDFAVETADGTRRLADYRGRKLAIFFYPRDDTPGCTTEARDFTALAPAFASAGTALLGVSRDSLDSHRRFSAKHGLAVELGADAEHRMLDAYGAWVEKSMYGRTSMGVERSTFLVDADGRLARVWRRVRVPGHAAAVLAAAQAPALNPGGDSP